MPERPAATLRMPLLGEAQAMAQEIGLKPHPPLEF
jgi:hypothetical protein